MSEATDRKYYTVEIAGVTRHLPLFEVAPGVSIAIFNMLGDTEVVEAAADELAKRLPRDADVLMTPEVKSIPLAHALSVRMGIPYVVARKIRKPYMVDSISVEVVSITTGKPQTLWLDGKDRPLIKDKRVILVDDVVSTGSTLQGMRKLVAEAGGTVVAEAAVFTEGEEDAWPEVIALGHLPVFKEA
ncbi:MAG TPA: adenine phosphoribosyltransferase [Caldilineae bacterium]|nr:adenine phosphoribosyltransferase [Caldilineae bacterium]